MTRTAMTTITSNTTSVYRVTTVWCYARPSTTRNTTASVPYAQNFIAKDCMTRPKGHQQERSLLLFIC